MTDIREETNTQESANEAQLPLTEGDQAANDEAVRPPLPEGSTVLHCVLVKDEENGDFELKVEGILVGVQEFDPYNPCHRFLAAVADKMPELMKEIGGATVERVTAPASVAANDASDASAADDAAADQ